MTTQALESWLAAREPAPPAALAARLVELARATPVEGTHAETLLLATGGVLQRLLRDHETARASALELLAADALATYAMEAQGDDPASLEARCAWAMRYFAEIADSA